MTGLQLRKFIRDFEELKEINKYNTNQEEGMGRLYDLGFKRALEMIEESMVKYGLKEAKG